MFTDQSTSTQTQIENTIARVEFRWNNMPPAEWVPEGICPRARYTDGTISAELEKDPHNWGLRILKHMRNLSSNTHRVASQSTRFQYWIESIESWHSIQSIEDLLAFQFNQFGSPDWIESVDKYWNLWYYRNILPELTSRDAPHLIFLSLPYQKKFTRVLSDVYTVISPPAF